MRWWLLALSSCGGSGSTQMGDYEIVWDEERADLQIWWAGRVVLDVEEIAVGVGQADISFSAGSYLFENVEAQWTKAVRLQPLNKRFEVPFTAELSDASGAAVGLLQIQPSPGGALIVDLQPLTNNANRARMTFRCQDGEPFLGTGGHAMDVDHQGQAFPLWVSEPGIGKTDDEDPPEDWAITGTRHAASFPDPFVLRPNIPAAVEVNTDSRVDADLCVDGNTWSLTTWERRFSMDVFAGPSPLDLIERRVQAAGGVQLPPDWAFAPWNDAVRGAARVREVAQTLRDAGAPASVIWTEDWKGGAQTPLGYRLSHEWDLDRELYPEAEALDAELEAAGFKWFAYFAPFISPDASNWEEVASFAIRDPETADPYLFISPSLTQISTLDLSDRDARAWAVGKMQALLDVGFDGWMADYAEWLPPDAILADGDALETHNRWPWLWQQVNAEAQQDADATFFARSGWLGSTAAAPIIWAGDQRTDFQTDDGLPSVVVMGLGMSVSGVALFTHDIAGYQSIGNPSSDREVWYRWCALGAFSPIMRTHHGAFLEDNWQFDTDPETLAHYTRYATEHMRLYPYRRGLAGLAERTGRPVLLHPAMIFDDAEWSQQDAWMLGESMLVAPVLTRGATQRDVSLPDDTDWYDWWTGQPAASGAVSAPIDEIPVFVPRGAIVPTFTQVPDTLAPATEDGVTDLEDVDNERTIYLFGGGQNTFVEGDGTTYETSGRATEHQTRSQTLTAGTLNVGGIALEIRGDVERTYTVIAYP